MCQPASPISNKGPTPLHPFFFFWNWTVWSSTTKTLMQDHCEVFIHEPLTKGLPSSDHHCLNVDWSQNNIFMVLLCFWIASLTECKTISHANCLSFSLQLQSYHHQPNLLCPLLAYVYYSCLKAPAKVVVPHCSEPLTFITACPKLGDHLQSISISFPSSNCEYSKYNHNIKPTSCCS